MGIHYIYQHIDPITKDILYIGVGSNGRAWESRKTQRSLVHAEYLSDLQDKGFVPNDWVVIYKRSIDKQTAHKEEYALIGKLKPKFNFEMGPKSIKKLTKEEVILLQTKVANGESRKAIGRHFKIDPHTVKHILSGGSNYYKAILDEISL